MCHSVFRSAGYFCTGPPDDLTNNIFTTWEQFNPLKNEKKAKKKKPTLSK